MKQLQFNKLVADSIGAKLTPTGHLTKFAIKIASNDAVKQLAALLQSRP